MIKNKISISLLCALIALQGGIFSASAAEPLMITNISVNRTDKSATIKWYTSQPSEAIIEYETNNTYDSNDNDYRYHVATNYKDKTSHAVSIFGLVPETTYHFRITARSQTQEVQSFDRTFVTKETIDNQAPDITRVSAVYVTGTTATIQWDTNEKSNSLVEYGSDRNYGQTRFDGNLVVNHDVTITGLVSGKQYYYRVKSTDEKNNTAVSSGYAFTANVYKEAENSKLYISDLKPISTNDSDITKTSAIISYRTNKLASCRVSYGKTTNLSQSIDCPAPRDFFHEVRIGGLEPGTRYYFKVESRDVFNKTVTRENLSFITLGEGPANDNPDDKADASWVSGEDLVFYSSFNEGIKANYALGNKNGSNSGANLVGNNSLSGQSLSVKDKTYITYNSLNNIANDQGTISLWFKPNWNGKDNKGHTLIDLSRGDEYFFIKKNKDNNLRFKLKNSDDEVYQPTNDATSRISAKKWYNVAVTWDYNRGMAELYLDGQKIASHKISGPPVNINSKIYVGAPIVEHWDIFGYADSTIDELKIYGRALSQSEIEALSDSNNIGINDGSQGQILGASTLDYTQPVALYKNSENGRIYAIYSNGYKHYIPSPSIFEGYGYDWAQITTVSPDVLERYSEVGLAKTPDSSTIYYLYGGKMIRKTVETAEIFNSYPNNKWENIIAISEADLAYYAEAVLIKDIDRPAVYVLENGKKLPVYSEEAFLRNGYSWDEIAILNKFHIDTFAIGEPIQ